MKKTGLVVAAAAAALFVAGCATQNNGHGIGKTFSAVHHDKNANSCKGKNGCKEKGKCNSKTKK